MISLLKSKLFWALLVLAGGGWYYWQGSQVDSAMKKPPTPVRVATVEQRDMPLHLSSVGTVVTTDSVAVRSRLDSQLMEVKFKDGDYVNAGDVLFVLDDRTLKAQLGQMEANYKRDTAQLEFLKAQFERSKQLASKGFESESDLDNARAAFEAQRGTAGASAAAIENTRVMLEYTRIEAPISGRTGTINITAGNTVKANDTQPLVTINQVKPIRVQVSLPQRYLGSVREAMSVAPVSVSALREGNATPSTGMLEYVDNAIDQSTGTFVARASFPNDDEALWPGMFVNLRLTLGEEKNALVIPEVAVQHGQLEDFVFVADGGKAVKRPVTVARLQDSLALIEKGLVAGEQVVVDGIMSLGDGSAITVTDEKK